MPKLTGQEVESTLSYIASAFGATGLITSVRNQISKEITRVYGLGYRDGQTDAENNFKAKEPEPPLITTLEAAASAFLSGERVRLTTKNSGVVAGRIIAMNRTSNANFVTLAAEHRYYEVYL